MTIRTRLTLRFTGLVSSIVAVAFACIYGFCWYFIGSDFYRRLDRKASTYGDMLLQYRIEPQLLGRISRLRKDNLPNQKVTVYDSDNVPIFTTNDRIVLGVPSRILEGIRQTEHRNFRWKQFYVAGIANTTPTGDYVILASAENLYGDSFLVQLLWALGALFLLIVGLIAFSGWLYAGDALGPMQRIEKQLNAIFPRNRQERLPIGNENDEIGRLSATVNHLLDRVEESFKLQRLFVANVSHELQNPLTQISSQLEVSLLNRRDPEAYEQTMRSVLEDVEALSTLTRELLRLSKVNQADAGTQLTESVRIDEVVWDVRDAVQAAHPRYRVTVEFESLPEDIELLSVTGNTSLLRTALTNLVENACKFSVNGEADVWVAFGEETVQLRVRNEGESIPAEDLPYIFEPFYRSRQSTAVQGYGVGLSLVERIVRLHQGRLIVQSGEGQPTMFQLDLFRHPAF